MNEEEFDRLLTELVARPDERTTLLRKSRASAEEAAHLDALVFTADAAWLATQGAPPLDEDPVAAMLGLVPDRECSLDPRSFTRARQHARIAPSALAQRLKLRGWDPSTADVVRWQNAAADVPPALVQAIADELAVAVDALIQPPDAATDRFEAIRRAPAFEDIVARWARVRHIALAVARAELDSRMAATVYRGQLPDTDQVLSALDTLVRSVEGAREY
ncbi:hypothetical protein [Microbacterium sp. 5K110]|jgi:hypothetical protein|uniref:hypothetical protein n=1 Tax=unclassified Microbacterium TaxID=2609290 RepID=UPI0010FE9A51|nr:hypothetical protein [Microbacterium sp. 5K110]TLF32689.1 hypothetical protein FE256_05090 [Microbacterium sp. 5K110]